MKELVVISGKGGTGKTSLLASFAALADRSVIADCDVDAADLHLVMGPDVERTTRFSGGSVARIDPARCTACGACHEYCRYGAVTRNGVSGAPVTGATESGDRASGAPGSGATASGDPASGVSTADLRAPGAPGSHDRASGAPVSGTPREAGTVGTPVYAVDRFACEGCGVCVEVCRFDAVIFEEETNGEWYVSRSRFGPMVHAKLGPGAENSGKLVTIVRGTAKHIAEERGIGLVLIDGSPGIGCPVIASITGADLVLVVTEPTKSGIHDLERVVELARHFRIPAAVAVNKSDINDQMSDAIKRYAAKERIDLAGCIRYDTEVTRAQMEGASVVEVSDGPASIDIKAIWERLHRTLFDPEREGT